MKNQIDKMANIDATVSPIWVFLWSFGLIAACFLAAHHWHYKIKSIKREKYAPLKPTIYKPVKATGPATSYKELKRREGGILLADE